MGFRLLRADLQWSVDTILLYLLFSICAGMIKNQRSLLIADDWCTTYYFQNNRSYGCYRIGTIGGWSWSHKSATRLILHFKNLNWTVYWKYYNIVIYCINIILFLYTAVPHSHNHEHGHHEHSGPDHEHAHHHKKRSLQQTDETGNKKQLLLNSVDNNVAGSEGSWGNLKLPQIPEVELHSMIGISLSLGFIFMLLVDQLFGGGHSHGGSGICILWSFLPECCFS